MNRKDFSERLKLALELRQIKATDLSLSSGISNSLISQYINGKKEPRSDKLMALAKALNVNEVWLMGYNVDIARPDSNLSEQDKMKMLIYGTTDVPEELWKETILLLAWQKKKLEEYNNDIR